MKLQEIENNEETLLQYNNEKSENQFFEVKCIQRKKSEKLFIWKSGTGIC